MERQLVRALTLVPASALILANVIGTGVFVKARVMTCNVESPEAVLWVWLVAGVLSLAGALVYAELSAMMPKPGGEFHFLGAAFGPRWAFLYGWTKTLSLGASGAAVAILFVVFLNDLLGGALPEVAVYLLPLLIIAAATFVNLATVRVNGLATTGLTAIKVGLVLIIGLGAFFWGAGDWGHFGLTGEAGSCEGVPDSARGGLGGFGAAMLGALWGYNGWAIISAVGGEVADPSRNIPRALIGGTLTIVFLYLMINAAYFYVLSPVEVASVSEASSVAAAAASRFLGPEVSAVLAVGLMISAYGTLHTTLLSGPRIPYTMARSNLLPETFAKLSDRSVPAVAVVVIGVWATVLAATGTFDILTDIYVFVLWVFFGMCGIALILLRRRHADFSRPYRVPGYPVIPLVFVLVTVYLLLNTLIVTPGRALAGVALILTGVPIFAYFQRKMDRVGPEAWLGDQD